MRRLEWGEVRCVSSKNHETHGDEGVDRSLEGYLIIVSENGLLEFYFATTYHIGI